MSQINTVIHLSLFLLVLWISGRLMRLVKCPSILVEILVGVILGPFLLNVVPEPSALAIAGEIGMSLIMLESGLHIHYDAVKKIGFKATIVALGGAILSLIIGIGIGYLVSGQLIPNSIYIGLVQIPTSVGISLSILGKYKNLDADYGQLIITAAFIDDIIALIILGLAKDLANGKLNWLAIMLNIVFTSLFLIIAIPLSIYVIPLFLEKIRVKLGHNHGEHLEIQDEIVLTLMFSLAILLSWLSSLFGSPLLGMFTTGIIFCKVISTHKVWKHQIKRIYSWLKRLFFAASIGFTIPIKEMISPESFAYGILLALLSGIFGKIIPTLWLKNDRWLVGWAMVARGEFGFLMANTFNQLNYYNGNTTALNPKDYSISLWSLIITCFISPVVFQYLIIQRNKSNTSDIKNHYQIRITGEKHHSMQEDIQDAIEDLHLELIDMEQHNKENNQVDIQLVAIGNVKEEELKQVIKSALGDNTENITIITSV